MSNFHQNKFLKLILCFLFVFCIANSVSAYEFEKNMVIVSYDVSGTMNSPRWVPGTVHKRVQEYLKYILGIENGAKNIEYSTGWNSRYLKNSSDKEVVSLPANHWLTKKGLLANNSGCVFVSFGDEVRELANYDIGSNKSNISLFYPDKFNDQNTIFENLLSNVSRIANVSAMKQANCYWVSVTDNVEDTNAVGGGNSNEAFTKFCSEKYYKPVLSIRLDISKKENDKKKDWQVYINVSHIADLSVAIKDYSDTYTSLEQEINSLGQNKLVNGSNDYIDCSYKLKDLKLNCDILNRSPNDINTADKIENCISELREKIKGIRMLLNKNEAYGDKIQSLKNDFTKFRDEYGNSDRLDSIEKDLIRVDENLSKMESAEISNSLSNVEKNLKDLKRAAIANINSNQKLNELIDREKSALQNVRSKLSEIVKKNSSLGEFATKTAELETLKDLLDQMEKALPNKNENDFNNTLAIQSRKLGEIESLIDEAYTLKVLKKKEESALEPIENKYQEIVQKNKNLGQLATKSAELEAIGANLKQLKSSIPDKDENEFNNSIAKQKAKLDEIENLIGYASKPEQYKRLQEFDSRIKELLNNNEVTQDKKEELAKAYEDLKNNFNSLSSDEIDKKLKELDYNIFSQSSGSSAGIVLVVFIVIALLIFIINSQINKPMSIIIESRQAEDEDWDNAKNFDYITTRNGSNRIYFGDNDKDMTYPHINSSNFIERRGGKLYLINGKHIKPILFGSKNSLSDSDAEFRIKKAGSKTYIKKNVTKSSSSSSNNTDEFDF